MTTRNLNLIAALITCLVFVAGGTTLAQTTFNGNVNNDINDPNNWSAGLPTNDGLNDGTVPNGFTALNGSPQNKNITFQGNAGYVANNFGGSNANGYNVVFNGTGNADFTGNGLFLAWDGGAPNDSSFEWNSTGQADTTRFFLSRFGAGTFTQSAGTINQNSGGGFDMVVGEFAPGVTWTMTGGTLNSAASVMQVRHGSMTQSDGTINANTMDWGNGASFNWDLSGGMINVTDVINFNSSDALNFTAGSTGMLNVLNSNYSIADAQADINAGRITLNGAPAAVGDFDISIVNFNNLDFTKIQLPQVDSVVPEPSTFALAVFGLLGLGLFGRPRRNRR